MKPSPKQLWKQAVSQLPVSAHHQSRNKVFNWFREIVSVEINCSKATGIPKLLTKHSSPPLHSPSPRLQLPAHTVSLSPKQQQQQALIGFSWGILKGKKKPTCFSDLFLASADTGLRIQSLSLTNRSYMELAVTWFKGEITTLFALHAKTKKEILEALTKRTAFYFSQKLTPPSPTAAQHLHLPLPTHNLG